MGKIIERLKEPSTMAGLSVLLLAFGVPIGQADLIMQIAAGVLGLGAMAMSEKSK